jgi:hypothetical protein
LPYFMSARVFFVSIFLTVCWSKTGLGDLPIMHDWVAKFLRGSRWAANWSVRFFALRKKEGWVLDRCCFRTQILTSCEQSIASPPPTEITHFLCEPMRNKRSVSFYQWETRDVFYRTNEKKFSVLFNQYEARAVFLFKK